MPQTLLHIGTHKTGSSSFQHWLEENRAALKEHAGVLLYEGVFGTNHFELGLLCQRGNRNGTGQVHFPDWCLDEWREKTRAHVAGQLKMAEDSGLALLISSEALSMLIHADELLELSRVLGNPGAGDVAVAVASRDPGDFLRSYRHEIGPGAWTDLKESAGYTEPDSWLVDYDALKAAWRSRFGTDALVEVGYEEAIQARGDVIPAIAEALGIDASSDYLTDWETRPWDWRSADKSEPALDSIADEDLRETAAGMLASARRRERRIGDLEAIVMLLEGRLSESRQETEALAVSARLQEEALAGIRASASWRLTAPARKVKHVARRARPRNAREGMRRLGYLAAGLGVAILPALFLLA